VDHITLRGIDVWAHHGVLPEERERGQRFVIDVAIEADLAAAAQSDDLWETVDYAVIAQDVVTAASGGPYELIERVALVVSEAVLRHDRVRAVEVTVSKPNAPLSVPLADVSVTLRRERG
jgi:7,8-dihydroneopterin aldolase/epimerase/oxygenase